MRNKPGPSSARAVQDEDYVDTSHQKGRRGSSKPLTNWFFVSRRHRSQDERGKKWMRFEMGIANFLLNYWQFIYSQVKNLVVVVNAISFLLCDYPKELKNSCFYCHLLLEPFMRLSFKITTKQRKMPNITGSREQRCTKQLLNHPAFQLH